MTLKENKICNLKLAEGYSLFEKVTETNTPNQYLCLTNGQTE